MFDRLERRYLLKLALDCRRKGLSAAETRKTMRDSIGAIASPGRMRCAIRHAFGTES